MLHSLPLLHGPFPYGACRFRFLLFVVISCCLHYSCLAVSMSCVVRSCGSYSQLKTASGVANFGHQSTAWTCTILQAGVRRRRRLSTSGLGRSSLKPPLVDWPLGPQVLLLLLLLQLLVFFLFPISTSAQRNII